MKSGGPKLGGDRAWRAVLWSLLTAWPSQA